jgi:predicted house-cleaning noncanonical NTP pyrophosphatase (MazG superfamily)
MVHSEFSSDSLYHYTDISAVASIIKNKKLWLTDIGFLNDSQEFHDGMSIVSRRVDEMVNEAGPEFEHIGGGLAFVQGVLGAYTAFSDASNVYTCSFSRAANLLSQWRAYGNFAIEFSRAELEKKYVLYECVYGDRDKGSLSEAILRSLIDEASEHLKSNSEEPLPALLEFTTRISNFKNHHFEAEHEIRIIGRSDYEKSGVYHRARGDVLIPYMEIDFPVESILAVHVGPIADQELAGRSLRSFLKSCGLHELPIVISDIPYRS